MQWLQLFKLSVTTILDLCTSSLKNGYIGEIGPSRAMSTSALAFRAARGSSADPTHTAAGYRSVVDRNFLLNVDAYYFSM